MPSLWAAGLSTGSETSLHTAERSNICFSAAPLSRPAVISDFSFLVFVPCTPQGCFQSCSAKAASVLGSISYWLVVMDNAWPDSCVRALVEISDEEAELHTPGTEAAEKGTEFGRWQRPAGRHGDKKEETLRKSPSGERLSLPSNWQDSARLPGLRQAMMVHAGALLRKKSEVLVLRRSLLTKELSPQAATPTPIRPSGVEGLAQARRRFEVVAPQSLAAKPGPPPDTSKPRKRVELLRKPQRPALTRTASLASLAVGIRVLSPPSDKTCWTLRLRSQASHSLLPLHPTLRDRGSL